MAIVPYDGWPWEGRRTLDIGDPPPVGFDESLHLLGVYFKRHGVVGVHIYLGERRAELTSFLWDHEDELIPNADEIENSLRLKGLLATDLDTGLDHPTPVGMDVLRTVEEVMKLSTDDYNNFHFLVYANSNRVWDYAKAMGRQLSHEDFNDWPVPMEEYFSHYQERRDLVGPIADNLYMTHIDGWQSQYSHGIIRVGNFATRLFKAWADKRINIIKIKSRQIILDVVGEHIGTEAAVKFAARPASLYTAMALAWRDELGLGERTYEVSTDYEVVMEEEVVRCYIGGRHVSTFQFYHSEVRQSFESLEELPVTGSSIVKSHRILDGQEDFFKNVTDKELEELSRLDLTAESMQSIERMRGGEDEDADGDG